MSETETPDRRDRDELTDRDDLTELLILNDPLYPAVMARHLYERMATAIIAAGWVHWPHECGPEAINRLLSARLDAAETYRNAGEVEALAAVPATRPGAAGQRRELPGAVQGGE